MEKATVLFVSANPTDSTRLRVDEEIREIMSAVRNGKYRDRLVLQGTFATRPGDMVRALNEHEPAALHLSGHGDDGAAIIVEDEQGASERLSSDQLAELLRVARSVRLVVLNACNTQAHAERLVSIVECAIGTKRRISDVAAIRFAAHFYESVSFGLSVGDAFDQAIFLLEVGRHDAEALQLNVSLGTDPKDMHLFSLPPARDEEKETVEIELQWLDDVRITGMKDLEARLRRYVIVALARMLNIPPDDIEEQVEI